MSVLARDAATALFVAVYLALGAWLELVARCWPGAPALRVPLVDDRE